MTFWTAMWITIWATGFEGSELMVAYPSLAACEAAVPVVSDTLGYDHTITCVESNVASGSIRPLPRPSDLGVK